MDIAPPRFRFSLRTLLILTAMLAVLLAQWPWTEWEPGYSPYDPFGAERVLTDRFKGVAIAEGIMLAAWAGAVFYRRRFSKIPNSN